MRSVDGRVGCGVGWETSHKLLSPFDGIGNYSEMAQGPRPTSVPARIHFHDFDIEVLAGLQTLHLDSLLFVFGRGLQVLQAGLELAAQPGLSKNS